MQGQNHIKFAELTYCLLYINTTSNKNQILITLDSCK